MYYTMWKQRSFALALIFAVSRLGAQGMGASASASSAEAVFAPFPSRLRAALREGAVVLSWEDSQDVAGRYAVYRSTIPLSSELAFASAAKIAEVDSGIQTFIDTPSEGAYYYLVLALGPDGSPYRVFIPARNATIAPVQVAPRESFARTAELASGRANMPNSIAAVRAEDAVIISYTMPEKGRRLVLYRGSAPITEAASLLDAVLVASFEDREGKIADYPVPGIDYWYALFLEEDLRSGRIVAEPGRNATRAPIRIPAGLYRVGLPEIPPVSRTPPLPYFWLERELVVGPDGTAMRLATPQASPERRELSPEAAKAQARLLALSPARLPARPVFTMLPEDSRTPSGGEEYALTLIVRDKLGRGAWEEGAEQLRKYLSLNRSPQVASRARYYLGVSLTATGAYREAFFEFLRAWEHYAAETKPWIDYIIAVLRNG